jgi:hypothetical protein
VKDVYYAASLGVFNSANTNSTSSIAVLRNKSAILSHLNLNTKAREELEKRKKAKLLEKEKEGKYTRNT